jgi:hypothetical protein
MNKIKMLIFETFVIPIYYKCRLNKISFLKKYDRLFHYCKGQKISTLQVQFGNTLRFFKHKPIEKSKRVVLTQMVDDYSYAPKLAAASKILAEKYNASVSFYDVHIYDSLGYLDERHKDYRKIFDTPIETIYLSFGADIAFTNDDLYNDPTKIKEALSVYKSQIKTPQDILAMSFENTPVGDLVYDTYLRFFDVPTMEMVNDDVFKIVEIGLNIFHNVKVYLKKNGVACLLTTYTAYLQHGLVARMCMKKGIPVYSMGTINYVIQKLTSEFPFHAINHTAFDPNRVLSAVQKETVEQLLQNRFSGSIDASNSYMSISAFSNSPVSEKLQNQFSLRKRNAVIYVHEFIDTPHENRKLQFPDLYQHLKQSLEALVEVKDTTVFIKVHPNGFKKSKKETRELVHSFDMDHFILLDDKVSSKHIISLKPTVIATVWGSVGLEMAYHEIPVITLYDCIYNNFEFVHTCYTTSEYFSILRGEVETLINYDREKIYIFYYQLFLEKTIVDGSAVFNRLTKIEHSAISEEYLQELLSSDIPDKYEQLLHEIKAKIFIKDN